MEKSTSQEKNNQLFESPNRLTNKILSAHTYPTHSPQIRLLEEEPALGFEEPVTVCVAPIVPLIHQLDPTDEIRVEILTIRLPVEARISEFPVCFTLF